MADRDVAASYAGDSWLAYCSNLSASDAAALRRAGDVNSPALAKAVSLAAEGLDEAVAAVRADLPGAGIVRPFIEWLRTNSRSSQHERSRVHQLRAEAGGTLAHETWASTGDPLVDLLTRECLRAYPAALIPPRLSLGVRFELGNADGQLATEFANEVIADPICSLFPLDVVDPMVDGSAWWHGPDRSASAQGLRELIDRMVEVTFLRVAVVFGEMTESQVIRSARRTIQDYRALAQGQKAEVVTQVIIDGLDMTDLPSSRVLTALGTVRSANHFDMEIQGVNLESRVGWPRLDEHYVSQHSASVLIPTSDELKTFPIPASKWESLPELALLGDFEKHRDMFNRSEVAITRHLNKLRISMLLSGLSDGVVLQSSVMTQATFFLSSRGSFQGSNDPPPPWTTKVDLAWAQRLRRWAQLIHDLDVAGLELAIERLLSAAQRPGRDGLVDAVVAWESLVGGSENTAFRVRTALALCVEPTDLCARTVVERKANELYAFRSHLVHGSKLRSRRQTDLRNRNPREEAILLGIKLLAAILLQWRGLVACDAEVRSTRVLLAGPTGVPLDPAYV